MKVIKTAAYEAIEKISSGLPRMWQHMLGGGSFGIVSAADDGNKMTQQGLAVNNQRNQELQSLLQKFDVGFVNMKGMWKNMEMQRYLPEKSVFIPNAREEDVRAVAEMFAQDSYVFGASGKFKIQKTDGSMVYLEGNISDHLRQITPEETNRIKNNPQEAETPGLSSVKGRPWVFDTERAKSLQNV